MNNQYYGNFYTPYPALLNQLQQNPNGARIQYDFVGKYVGSYDDVKNAPFADQTVLYVDADHDRIYIKEISKDGSPIINVLGICDVQQNKQTEDKKDDWADSVNESIEKINKKINELEVAMAAAKF